MRILFATGGSGGHIFPALETALSLKNSGHDIIFVTTKSPISEKLRAKKFSTHFVSSRGLSTSSLKNIFVSSFCMFRALAESFSILRKTRPDAVVGFGGYGAFPVVLAAVLLRRPTLIHEQNVVPGRANRLLAKYVCAIAISFKETEKYFPGNKTILTGCPCRAVALNKDREQILTRFNLFKNKYTMLILGGSQGSQRMNGKFLKTAGMLRGIIDFQVIHMAGPHDYELLKDEYRTLGIGAAVFSFLDDMDLAYAIADLVISRAGAVTVAEIMANRIPAIVIPYPFAGGHQKENAKILAQVGIASIIEDSDLKSENLRDEILKNHKDRLSKDNIAEKLKDIYTSDSAKRLAEAIVTF